MRKPQVVNRYNLTIPKIRKLKVTDRDKIHPPLFWRNPLIKAWCVSGHAGTEKDREFGTDNGFWIGIYDINAPAYAGKFRVDFSSYGGMCGYKFRSFFNPKDIDNENDLLIQEKFLYTINHLIDIGVLEIAEK